MKLNDIKMENNFDKKISKSLKKAKASNQNEMKNDKAIAQTENQNNNCTPTAYTSNKKNYI